MSVMSETPVLKVEGKEYPLKRLGINAAFKLIRVIRKIGTSQAVNAIMEIVKQLDTKETPTAYAANKEKERAEAMKSARALAAASVIIENIENAEAEFNEFAATLLKITPEEFSEFPIYALPQLVEAVIVHPDIKVFTQSVKMAMKAQQTAASPIAD